MKILLTGASGYVGARLLFPLLEAGHEVTVLVRRRRKFDIPKKYRAQLKMVKGDLLFPESLTSIPEKIDAAYYLVHSMSDSASNFTDLEKQCITNFVNAIKRSKPKQLIYLSGISNDKFLSEHLLSRASVEGVIENCGIPYTILKAGAIIGSGSASFEIIRDLVEKLPFMVTPKWVLNKTEPIAIRDVLFYLQAVLGLKKAYNQTFEIGSNEQLTYEQMLKQYGQIRGLNRYMLRVPVLTPHLSSYWLYFVTSTNFSLARSLVDSLRNETVCKDFRIRKLIPHETLSYKEAVRLALERVAQNHIISSWRDALSLSRLNPDLQAYIHVPAEGCLIDFQSELLPTNYAYVIDRIWKIGGDTGWYYADFLWEIRGFFDKLVGGTGLNRGRTHKDSIASGDAVDFWRVLVADKKEERLLLYAEMKLPGEAWLEFKIVHKKGKHFLEQTATFRPKGIWGRLYWYLCFPFHLFIFKGMLRALIKKPGKRK